MITCNLKQIKPLGVATFNLNSGLFKAQTHPSNISFIQTAGKICDLHYVELGYEKTIIDGLYCM